MRRVAIAAIRSYQQAVSPMFGARCKYYPSCSEYAALATREHGTARGLLMAGWRLLRCNPLSRGGVDYPNGRRVPSQ